MASPGTLVMICSFDVNYSGNSQGLKEKIAGLGFTVSVRELGESEYISCSIANPTRSKINDFFDAIENKKEPVENEYCNEDSFIVIHSTGAQGQNRADLNGNSVNMENESNSVGQDHLLLKCNDSQRMGDRAAEASEDDFDLAKFPKEIEKEDFNEGYASDDSDQISFQTVDQDNEYFECKESDHGPGVKDDLSLTNEKSQNWKENDFGQRKEMKCYENVSKSYKKQKGECDDAIGSPHGSLTQVGNRDDAERLCKVHGEGLSDGNKVSRHGERLYCKENEDDQIEESRIAGLEERPQKENSDDQSEESQVARHKERLRKENRVDQSEGSRIARREERPQKKNSDDQSEESQVARHKERLRKENHDDQSEGSQIVRQRERPQKENSDDQNDVCSEKRISPGRKEVGKGDEASVHADKQMHCPVEARTSQITRQMAGNNDASHAFAEDENLRKTGFHTQVSSHVELQCEKNKCEKAESHEEYEGQGERKRSSTIEQHTSFHGNNPEEEERKKTERNAQSYGNSQEEENCDEGKVSTTFICTKNEYLFTMNWFSNHNKDVLEHLKNWNHERSSYWIQIENKEVAEELSYIKSQLKQKRVHFESKETLEKITEKWGHDISVEHEFEYGFSKLLTTKGVLKRIEKEYPGIFSHGVSSTASSVANRKNQPNIQENAVAMGQDIPVASGGQNSGRQSSCTSADNFTFIGRSGSTASSVANRKNQPNIQENAVAMGQDIPVASGGGSSGRQSSCTSADNFTFIGHDSSLNVKVHKANITYLAVDVIVNAANRHLKHGGGVARAISSAAGYKLKDECEKYIKKNEKVEVTHLFASTGGDLKVKKIFHAVGPRWDRYKDNPEECRRMLMLTIFRCLIRAEEEKFQSIAFPSISAAIFKVPKRICVKSYMEAVLHFEMMRKTEFLELVHFVDIDDSMVNAIRDYFISNWDVGLNENDPNVEKDRNVLMNSIKRSTIPSGTKWSSASSDRNYGNRSSYDTTGTATSDLSSASSDRNYGNRSSYDTTGTATSDLSSASSDRNYGNRSSYDTTGTATSDRSSASSDRKYGNRSSYDTTGTATSNRSSASSDRNYGNRSSYDTTGTATSDRPSASSDTKQGNRSSYDTTGTATSDRSSAYSDRNYGNRSSYDTTGTATSDRPSASSDRNYGNRSSYDTTGTATSDRPSASSDRNYGNRSSYDTTGTATSDRPSASSDRNYGNRSSYDTTGTATSDRPSASSDRNYGNRSSYDTTGTATSDRPSASSDRNYGNRSSYDTTGTATSDLSSASSDRKYGNRSSYDTTGTATSDRPSASSDTKQGNRSSYDATGTATSGRSSAYSDRKQGNESPYNNTGIYSHGVSAHGTKPDYSTAWVGEKSQSHQPTFADIAGARGSSYLECSICSNNKKEFYSCPACKKQLCTDCNARVQQCPFCQKIKGKLTGDMPDGFMCVLLWRRPLHGFPSNSYHYELKYYFNERSLVRPHRTAYLPYSPGVLGLLVVAFLRRLTFTKGQSVTTGRQNQIIWNDIHHKTSLLRGDQYGYPDKDYLDRLVMELKSKGVSYENVTEVEKYQVRNCLQDLKIRGDARISTPFD